MGISIVVAIAAFFYFYQLGRPDIITDEASHAVRAIGLVDFDFGIEQPTPWQWVENVPWWMHLSFHDHPIMLFLTQHLSIRAFGETPFAARVPSALAGIAAVIFLYLIGKRLYGATAGLAAAAIFAVTVNHVWISRIGLFESMAIAFMLAAFWAFLRGLERPVFLPLAGVLIGFAFLTKYTALVLIPIFLTLLLVRRAVLPPRFKFYFYFLLSIFCFLIVASPVIIYNIQLYRNFGHFDFQFSLLFGQQVEAWQARPGQEVLGPLAERIRTFVPRLMEANSPYFLILSAIGLATILAQAIRRRQLPEHHPLVISHWLLFICFIWLLPFLIFIGPAHRFLTLLTPWLAIAAGYAITQLNYSQILKNLRIGWPAVTFAAFVAFVAFEAFYSYSSVVALDPIGSKPWAYSYLHRQAGSWGFNQLNAYLDAELKGKMPDPAITFEFPFARDILDEARAAGSRQGLQPVPWGIVYNDNINLASQLWVFLRRITYHGWLVASAEDFRRGGADQFFRQSGIRQVYFINPTEQALQDRTRPATPDGDIMEAELKAEGLAPEEIQNARGEVAFRVYQFELR